MNTILQKRIEEKSKELGQMFFPDNMNVFARPNWEAGYIETACKEIANFALQNQWISVDEALPEEKTKVFVIVKTPVGIVHRADYHINDYWYMSRYSPEEIVTHWMPIPSLKGGEK